MHRWLFRQILVKSGYSLLAIVNILWMTMMMMMMMTTTTTIAVTTTTTISDNNAIITIITILFGTA
jgi:hypothetical protein